MNGFSVKGGACFAHRIMGSPRGKNCESLQRNVWRGVVSPLKRRVFGHRMLLKSKKHLDEIWPLIKSQPLLREIVIVYIIKDLSKKEIYYVIYSYHASQTIKLEDTTVQPKAAVCGQSGFRIPNLYLIILAPIMHILALTWKNLIKAALKQQH